MSANLMSHLIYFDMSPDKGTQRVESLQRNSFEFQFAKRIFYENHFENISAEVERQEDYQIHDVKYFYSKVLIDKFNKRLEKVKKRRPGKSFG